MFRASAPTGWRGPERIGRGGVSGSVGGWRNGGRGVVAWRGGRGAGCHARGRAARSHAGRAADADWGHRAQRGAARGAAEQLPHRRRGRARRVGRGGDQARRRAASRRRLVAGEADQAGKRYLVWVYGALPNARIFAGRTPKTSTV